MSEKSIYKKATGKAWNYDPDNVRSKEDKFFKQTTSDTVKGKKKAQPKTVERADHKHEQLYYNSYKEFDGITYIFI